MSAGGFVLSWGLCLCLTGVGEGSESLAVENLPKSFGSCWQAGAGSALSLWDAVLLEWGENPLRNENNPPVLS